MLLMIAYREMVGQLTSISISGGQVSRFLNLMIEQRGKPDPLLSSGLLDGGAYGATALLGWVLSNPKTDSKCLGGKP